MNISIFGLGYVGAVITGCFARGGHRVIGVDMDPGKVALICQGKSPIIEDGLEPLIREGVENGRIHATADTREAIATTEVSMICVGTPSLPTGDLDLSYVRRVSEQIGDALREKDSYHLVVARSTMLPGSVEEAIIPAIEAASEKRVGGGFGVAINPEFLREGTAVYDFEHPPKTVIGAASEKDAAIIAQLYSGLDAPLIVTSIRTAEMVKYSDNVFHALKATFANEIGGLCKDLGIDGREVLKIFCQDQKLNLSPAYLKPGFAFGGSCLPKDLRALTRLAQARDVPARMIAAIAESNREQIARAIGRILATGARRIGVLGFAFKGGTDDLRESPVVTVIEALLGKGCELKLHDSYVSLARLVGANRRYIEERIPHISRLMVDSAQEAVTGTDAVLIGNQNPETAAVLGGLSPEQWVFDLTPASEPPQTPARYERVAS